MTDTKKTKGQLLADQLILTPENSGITMSDKDIKAANTFAQGYKLFLDAAKTEREAVIEILRIVTAKGYTEFDRTKKYKAGDKVYRNNRGRALILSTIGKAPLTEGVRIMASHLDSPRLDLKPRPLYEEAQLAYLKTHYYGGVKKYQWSALPLALHGVVAKKDGSIVTVCIGEDDADPVFSVTDLLPHLAKDQMKRPLSEGIKGEELNILIGCQPFKDDKASEKVKLAIAKLLFEKYAITEADFLSADLCAVPAHKAKDVGLDRSMVGAYGHDDRVCAYTSLLAEIECKTPTHTTVTVFADREEIGSDGNTGLKSNYMKYFIKDLGEIHGISGRHIFEKSYCFSADVNCAFDPTFPEVSERKNTSYLNYGVVITKYTGSGGKYGTSEAGAEFMAWIRNLLDDGKVIWQTGELGKVDQGGGGTVAKYIASLDIDVVDIGVPVLSMHSPFEIVSKADIYMTYKAFKEFCK